MPRTKTKPAIEPTALELEVLTAYAAKFGGGWKEFLLWDWRTGSDVTNGDKLIEDGGSVLRSIRNRYGPSWLDGFELPESA